MSGRGVEEHAQVVRIYERRTTGNGNNVNSPPKTTEFVVCNPLVSSPFESFCEISLLLDVEQNIALHAEDECRDVTQILESCSEIVKVWRVTGRQRGSARR